MPNKFVSEGKEKKNENVKIPWVPDILIPTIAAAMLLKSIQQGAWGTNLPRQPDFTKIQKNTINAKSKGPTCEMSKKGSFLLPLFWINWITG